MKNIEIQIEKCLKTLRETSVHLVGLLLEVDRSDLHLLQAHPSLNQYLIKRFQMSPQQAYFYANAVKLLKKHPQFFEDLKAGALCLSNLDLVARKAEEQALIRKTPKNEVEKDLINEAKGKTKQEFREHLEARSNKCESAPKPLFDLPRPCRSVRLDQEAEDLLKELGDEFGGKSEAEIIKLALKRMLAQKRLQTTPRNTSRIIPKPHQGRYVPATVKRTTRERARHQCEFRSKEGKRCESRSFLQYDHVQPHTLGGTNEASNIQLLCASHNRMRARVGGLMPRSVGFA